MKKVNSGTDWFGGLLPLIIVITGIGIVYLMLYIYYSEPTYKDINIEAYELWQRNQRE